MEHEGKLAVSPKVAAQMVSISRSKFYQLLASGDVKSVFIGNRRLIPITELERIVREGVK